MLIWEVVGQKDRKTKPNRKTDFEKNATRLRSKERKLDAKKPVKPVSTD